MNKPVILPISSDPQFTHIFHCPGCEGGHGINTNPANGRPLWTLSGPPDSPTISPSILVRGWHYNKEADKDEPITCHSFVREGKIQFLSDCTHKLAGQTVELPPA